MYLLKMIYFSVMSLGFCSGIGVGVRTMFPLRHVINIVWSKFCMSLKKKGGGGVHERHYLVHLI